MRYKDFVVNVMVIVACIFLMTASRGMAQDVCYADITGFNGAPPDGKVGLPDLVQLKTEYNRTDCAPCATVEALEARIAQLETLLANVTRVGNDITFSGVNVHVVDGSGDTGGEVNGLGNLIVGYNEPRGSGQIDDRTGSHNIVVGSQHNYSSYGGLVVGQSNTISGAYASVSGGVVNEATAPYASVSGGYNNTASGIEASVSGGAYNTASGIAASVSGGQLNTASGMVVSVSGGASNTASGDVASVSGGQDNTASGIAASVSGGVYNQAIGDYSFVGGGGSSNPLYGNYASADYSAVLGGANNTAGDPDRVTPDHNIGPWATVGGGRNNNASGDYSSVSGGNGRSAADDDDDWQAGSLWEDN